MCEAVVPEPRPLNVTWTRSVLAAGSKVIAANPVAVEPVAGTSSAPVRLAWNVVGAA